MKNHLRNEWNNLKKGMILGLVIGGVIFLSFADLQAQDTASQDEDTKELIQLKRRLPKLNGHNYIPSSNITQTPFITTYFSNSTGVGNAFGFEIPLYNSEGVVISTIDANITYMILDLAYQQAVSDWLAFWISGSGVGRIGTNVESILSQVCR